MLLCSIFNQPTDFLINWADRSLRGNDVIIIYRNRFVRIDFKVTEGGLVGLVTR